MKKIKAALVVQNCIAGGFEKNLESSLYFISSANKKGAKIIIFPEMNLTGYVAGPDIISISRPINKDMVDLFSNRAKDLKTTILIGLAEKTPQKKNICVTLGV